MGIERKLAKIEALGEKKDWKKLVKKFGDAKDAALRIACADALAKIPVDEAYNKLTTDLMHDSDINVVKAAIRALGDMGRKSGAEHVRHTMEHATDAELIQECQVALSKIANSDSRR